MSCLRLSIFVCFLLALVVGGAAKAGPYEDALKGFTEGSISDTGDAIAGVVASGDPLAKSVLDALQDARLMFSAQQKTVFIKSKDGKLIDAATGQTFTGTAPEDLDTVIVNNRLRNVIDAATGTLTLMSPDASARYDAAASVFKSHEASALPALDAALAKEINPRVRQALLEARAAVIVTSADSPAEAKIDAIAVLRARGDQDAVNLLDTMAAQDAPAVREAVASAKSAIQEKLALWGMMQNAWYGLSLGSVLLLAAIGLAITFGVMGVINMAHGEMVMLGAYVTYVVQELIRTT